MTGDRTEAAVQRIEAALARIAGAAETPVSPVPPPSVPSSDARPNPGVLALVERHEALRDVVAQSLAELDAVISELEQ